MSRKNEEYEGADGGTETPNDIGGTPSVKNKPKKRIILRGLCEQCKKKQKPRTKLFEELTRADVVLLHAATEGHSQCVSACLKAGANANQLVPVEEDLMYWRNERETCNHHTTALLKSSENGHHECLSSLIKAGAGVKFTEEKGATALYYAALGGHPECVKFLIKEGADVNISKFYNSPLNAAVRSSNFSAECFNALIEAGADVNETGNDWQTPLVALISHCHSEHIESLIKAGADVNISDSAERTPLHHLTSAKELTTDGLILLIRAGVDVNKTNHWKGTALHNTAEMGHIEATKLLMKTGANVDVRDDNGNTALMNAASAGCTEIIHIFIEAGADVNSFNDEGETSLILAASKGHTSCFEKLIRAGADVNSRNCRGRTALMEAVRNEESLRYLIEAGADVNCQDREGWTALMYAKNEDCLRCLIKFGADVNSQNCKGWTALMHAANNENSLKCLIEAGADMNKQNYYGQTALKLAFTKNFKCSYLLLEAGSDVNTRFKYGNTILSFASMYWRSVPVKSLIAAGADVNVVDFSRNTLLHIILRKTIGHGKHCSKAIQCIKFVLSGGAKINMLNISYTKALTSYFQLRSHKVNSLLQTCLSKVLIDTSRPYYGSPSSGSVCNGACEAELITLFFAAGETMDDHPVKVSDYLDPPSDICLSHICREVIREHLLLVDQHENLFCRAEQLGLPSALQQYLVYNVSLIDDDINNNNDATTTTEDLIPAGIDYDDEEEDDEEEDFDFGM